MTMSIVPDVGFMFDIESLDLGTQAVVTQIAFVAFDLADPETVLKEVTEYLPIQPQLALGRTISAKTIIWWMQQDDKARNRFKQNDGDDMDELLALMRSVARKASQVIAESNGYEIWARGPQFDIANIESLLSACGEKAPWKYGAVRDLRTLMSQAGLHVSDVPRRPTLIEHVALDDCKYQIECYVEAIRRLHSVK